MNFNSHIRIYFLLRIGAFETDIIMDIINENTAKHLKADCKLTVELIGNNP